MDKFKLLKQQLQLGVFPHAYLFSGNDLEAKEGAINLIKKNYLDSQSPDFFEINPVDGKISIDEIRTLKEKSLLTSVGGKNIFLVRGIEHLNREAEVAMLKTIEDLPQSSILLATCENYASLLPAIKSRFSHLRFFKESDPKDILADSEDLEILVRKSLLNNMNVLRKNLSPLNIFKVEKLLSLQILLPISALNRRMARDYLEMLERVI